MEEILYAAIEVLERLEAGIPVASLLDGRLLTVGVVVQVAIAVGLAVLLAVVPGPGCTMEDVNDQPPHQHPDRHGAVSTRLAADPTPPGAGAPGWRLWAATLARLLLAAVWAWAALAKISDPDAAVRAVRAYQLLPEALVRPVAWGLPFAELVLALLLVVGLATRLAAAGSAVLLGLFMVAIAAAWARGLQIHCGCFGGGGPATGVDARDYLGELIRDAGLLAVAVLLAWRPRSRLALDGRLAPEEP